MIITRHARKRIKERMGLPKKAIHRHMYKVIQSGIHQDQMIGRLREYAILVIESHDNNCNSTLLYGHHLFLFNDSVLVTVLDVPTELKELATLLQKNNDYE